MDYKKRMELLREHGIGLWDTIASCDRKGSLDATIRNEKPNDFYELFNKYPNIQLVLFNSIKAFDVFKKHIGFEVLGNRFYKEMPSKSPIPGANIKTFEEKMEDWRIMVSYL